MSDVQNIAVYASARAQRAKEARKNAIVQTAAGAILLAVGYFTATSGYGEIVGPAHPVCAAVVLAGGLFLCVQAMFVVFRALLAQYEHFAMSAEEAAFSLYEFRVAAALVLTGLRLLLPWRAGQVICDLALAALLGYCAVTRLLAVNWRDVRGVIGGVLSALCALAALSLIAGVFAGFSWSLSVGLAAAGFALDSLYCALNGTNI
ncbi:MAG TPA: hypothetical protein IAA52_02640 [Candidatus Pullichristensenella stercorigallinarum]|uniref:Uncharacterized protein n=1 Tax=Candidatus Pullichristensenella stercorigallinarum TaxID=2840909 RepID=A0A9D1CVG9_9FIRM|nr:hypothetical protein [Candidatus Pullichristensenella stercorigallinarum]